MNHSKQSFIFFGKILLVFVLVFCLGASFDAQAKSKKRVVSQKNLKAAFNARLYKDPSSDDYRRYRALTKKQQKALLKGQPKKGFNQWMVRATWGEPYYATEHHPIYKDYEEVWLYVKPRVTQKKTEKKIHNPGDNWPTLHRTVVTTRCQIGDYFILWDRGVVNKIKKDKSEQVHGSCVQKTDQAFIPIVNGKPIED